VEIEGLTVYGSPWQPEFGSWAFNLPRGHQLRNKWRLIPPNTDILVTHGPPKGILDMTPRGESVGCEDLRHRLGAIAPKLHVFGHVHRGYGETAQADTHFVNASICDESYKPVNPPVVVELSHNK
jgi:Icc-related predicted phosphoesterase